MLKNNLKRLLEERAVTPEALATKMQGAGNPVTAGTVRAWMYGYRVPSFQNVIAMAAALECTIDELVAEKAAV